MLLAIDIGNTNVSVGVFDHARLLAHLKVPGARPFTPDGFGEALCSGLLSEDIAISRIDKVIVASVVPSMDGIVSNSVARILPGVCLDFADIGNAGVEVLAQKSGVGVDRVVNARSAIELYKAPVVVVDMGTALTIDYVNEKREFVGGIIAPGASLGARALYEWTEKLPKVALARQEKVIGANTKEAIGSGLYWGAVSMIEGLVARVRKEAGIEAFVVATGGASELIAPSLSCVNAVDEFLTLRGLMFIASDKDK